MTKSILASHHAAQSRRLRNLTQGRHKGLGGRPVAAYRSRGSATSGKRPSFSAPEKWHAPGSASRKPRFIVQEPGKGYRHPVTVQEVRERLDSLPVELIRDLEVIQFSRMTRKRLAFPCYGMQWGWAIYLHPIEEDLVEAYNRPPTPAQRIEAGMFGARWVEDDGLWKLCWTEPAIKDYYLNNILIHEIGHLIDNRNTRRQDRERFAEWFAIEYGYRATGGRRARVG